MTRAFKCKECGNIVDFDSYPPSMREIYLTLESAKLCEVCGGDLKIVKEEPMATNIWKDEKCSHDSIPRSMIVDGAKCKRCEKTLTEEDWDNSLYATHYRLCKKCASKIDI